MRLSFVAVALALSIPVAACGDDDGGSASSFAGNYQIGSYTEATGDCAATGTAVPNMTTAVVKAGDFFGMPTLEVYVCEALAGCGVGEDAFPEFTFLQKKGATWVTDAQASSYGGGQCALSLTAMTLMEMDGGIHIERTMSSGSFEMTEAACEPEAATAKKTELTCQSKAVLHATPLDD